jgi:hypothetical protein
VNADGRELVDSTFAVDQVRDVPAAIEVAGNWLRETLKVDLIAVGHRVVHGATAMRTMPSSPPSATTSAAQQRQERGEGKPETFHRTPAIHEGEHPSRVLIGKAFHHDGH